MATVLPRVVVAASDAFDWCPAPEQPIDVRFAEKEVVDRALAVHPTGKRTVAQPVRAIALLLEPANETRRRRSLFVWIRAQLDEHRGVEPGDGRARAEECVRLVPLHVALDERDGNRHIPEQRVERGETDSRVEGSIGFPGADDRRLVEVLGSASRGTCMTAVPSRSEVAQLKRVTC